MNVDDKVRVKTVSGEGAVTFLEGVVAGRRNGDGSYPVAPLGLSRGRLWPGTRISTPGTPGAATEPASAVAGLLTRQGPPQPRRRLPQVDGPHPKFRLGVRAGMQASRCLGRIPPSWAGTPMSRVISLALGYQVALHSLQPAMPVSCEPEMRSDLTVTEPLPEVSPEAGRFARLEVPERVEARMLCFMLPMSRFVEPSFSWASLERPVTGSSYSMHFRYITAAFWNLSS